MVDDEYDIKTSYKKCVGTNISIFINWMTLTVYHYSIHIYII